VTPTPLEKSAKSLAPPLVRRYNRGLRFFFAYVFGVRNGLGDAGSVVFQMRPIARLRFNP
jgi:hypothetical protein